MSIYNEKFNCFIKERWRRRRRRNEDSQSVNGSDLIVAQMNEYCFLMNWPPLFNSSLLPMLYHKMSISLGFHSMGIILDVECMHPERKWIWWIDDWFRLNNMCVGDWLFQLCCWRIWNSSRIWTFSRGCAYECWDCSFVLIVCHTSTRKTVSLQYEHGNATEDDAILQMNCHILWVVDIFLSHTPHKCELFVARFSGTNRMRTRFVDDVACADCWSLFWSTLLRASIDDWPWPLWKHGSDRTPSTISVVFTHAGCSATSDASSSLTSM